MARGIFGGHSRGRVPPFRISQYREKGIDATDVLASDKVSDEVAFEERTFRQCVCPPSALFLLDALFPLTFRPMISNENADLTLMAMVTLP